MICTQCPRRCGAQRTQQLGAGHCRMPMPPVLARAALHQWEEPPISGQRGSGTIFFSGCPLDCLYCQNADISHRDFGRAVSPARLREICMELIDQGAHNINLVNPTHYAHVAVQLLGEPLPVPVVWNTGGYERVRTLRTLEGKVDIYLPDLKYLDGTLAQAYSGAEDYPQVATRAIQEMVRQTGPYQLADGLLRRGVIIRHLLLPGHVAQAKQVMDWVAAQFPPQTVLFSLMSQYVPCDRANQVPQLNRALRPSEVRSAVAYMRNLGLSGFIQDEAAAQTAFIPSFDLTGL